jgi:prolyl oligopeptidase
MSRQDRTRRASKFGASRRTVLAGGAASGLLAIANTALGQSTFPEIPNPELLPPAPRDGTVDVRHGTRVPDPFRPLEEFGARRRQCLDRRADERARAFRVLQTRPSPVYAVLNYPRTSIPARHGARYFTYFNNGVDDQFSYGVQQGLGGARRTLIDPKTLSRDGTTSVSDAFPDRNGTHVAYLTSEAGSDQQTLRIREVDTTLNLPDTLSWCKHTSVAWHPDGRYIFYTRYPNDSDPSDWDRRSQVLCLHRVVTPQLADPVIFRLPALRDVYLRVDTSFEDGLLKIRAQIGTSERRGYYVASLDDPSRVSELVPVDLAGFAPIGNLGPAHYALTNLDAPKWRLVRIDRSDPRPALRTIIAERTAVTTRPCSVLHGRPLFDNHQCPHLICVSMAGHCRASISATSRACGSGATVARTIIYPGSGDHQRPSRIERRTRPARPRCASLRRHQTCQTWSCVRCS